MTIKLSIILIFWFSFSVIAQEYFPKNDGIKAPNNNFTAFINAKIYVTPREIIDNGALLIQKGKVIASGPSVEIPKNSLVIDLEGKYIYPSFIDIYTDFGIEKPKKVIKSRGNPQYDPSREGFYWNDHVMPENNAMDYFKFDRKKAEELLRSGFGVVNTHIQDGIVRGTSILVTLNTKADNSERVLDQHAAQHLSFSRSSISGQRYPTSIMGAMALLRQLYHDTQWYSSGNTTTKDMAIEAFQEHRMLPQIFEANHKLNSLRADKISDEFHLNYIIKGGGDEFERISDIAATKASYIIPVNFPAAYDVTDPYQADKVTLAEMRFWNQAPINLKVLAENNINFALTTAGLDNVSDFNPNVRRAIAYGFDAVKALEALTTIPAALMGQDAVLGNLRKGAYANFLITSGPVFDHNTILYENWVQGKKHSVEDRNSIDIRGMYILKVSGKEMILNISGELKKPKAELTFGTKKIPSKIKYTAGWMGLFYRIPDTSSARYTRLTAPITTQGEIRGDGELPDGSKTSWIAVRKEPYVPAEKTSLEEVTAPKVFPITYPNKAYGFITMPNQQTVLFKNATVWTGEASGIMENTDVLVENGKIAAIGQNIIHGKGTTIIDATGKHITAGLIDEHSHIAASAINEAGHNSSAEVTIEDVVNSEDSNIYRNLSGGVTTIQILHGSANPIGGRSAIIKLKWGKSPEQLLLDNRPKFIKFALGENVKQSNWGDAERKRFPQSRMGVEQVFKDYFQRATEYDLRWKKYHALSKKAKAGRKAPRRDIEMETLVEILNKERFISCHSYVQHEINMLMKVAEQFHFTVNTFTHILEGYKVADKMKTHGAGGSTFSDWWGYKFEVNDAIPYNAAIMHQQGVTVAINSDNAEMSRRLNQEAAKTIKYGGLSEEEAWKTVTLNPAKLLHIDDRTGSIKKGKDADLVLWNNHPLSIYASVEKTMIEGVFYYDHDIDQELQKRIGEERNELINRMIQAKNKGMKTQPPKQKEEEPAHCNTMIYQ